MVATTHSEFGHDTEALEVAKAFADGIRGKTILVTGVNLDGIGFTTAQAFASQSPAHIILTGRSPEKLQKCIDSLRADYPDVDYRPLIVELSSQKSVRAAAAEVLGWDDVPTIDIQVNNAGVMMLPERTLNEDGIEMHLATNHLGHFLLTVLLMPKLIAAAKKNGPGATRVVQISALVLGRLKFRWSDINFDRLNKELPESEQPIYDVMNLWDETDVGQKSYIPIDGYMRTKVANVLFGVGLTDRLFARYGICSSAVHPGVTPTELGRHQQNEKTATVIKGMIEKGFFRYKTQGAGAATGLVAALDPKLSEGLRTAEEKAKHPTIHNYGAFLLDCQVRSDIAENVVSSSEADKLWELSEKLVGEKFSW